MVIKNVLFYILLKNKSEQFSWGYYKTEGNYTGR